MQTGTGVTAHGRTAQQAEPDRARRYRLELQVSLIIICYPVSLRRDRKARTCMRAVGFFEPGGPDVLKVVERVVGEPGEGEVRIAVRAAAVNPADLSLRSRGGGALPPPWTPGMEAAGTIDAVGAGVDRLAVGDEVMAVVNPFGPHGGAQAESLIVPSEQVVPIPDGISLQQAATIPMNGLTARQGLELLGLSPGSTLAITGGAGQLASFVIALARQQRLRIVADAAAQDARRMRDAGVGEVVDRGPGYVPAVRAAVPDGVDGLFDTEVLQAGALGAVRDGGTQIDVQGWEPPHTERAITVKQVFAFHAFARTDWLLELRRLAGDGHLPLRAIREFDPEQAGDAHELIQAGGLRDRAVIVFDTQAN